MGDWDHLLRQVEERETDPQWQEAQERRRAERLVSYDRALRRAIDEAIGRAGIPEHHLAVIAAGEMSRTAAVEATEQGHTLLVLSGGAGSGKTTAACSWLHGYIADPGAWPSVDAWDGMLMAGNPKRQPLFVTAAKLSRWGRYDDAAMARILGAQRLVLDDLGVEYLDEKGAYVSLLDELINERYAMKRPTVITTNLLADDFVRRYGERIRDRIREVGKFVNVGRDSMRKRPATPAETAAANGTNGKGHA